MHACRLSIDFRGPPTATYTVRGADYYILQKTQAQSPKFQEPRPALYTLFEF